MAKLDELKESLNTLRTHAGRGLQPRLKRLNTPIIAPIKADFNLLKWMMGALMAIAIANFSKQFL